MEDRAHVNPRERQSAHLGIGGTLAGNALTVAAMRAVLEKVLTPENYERHDRDRDAACRREPRHHRGHIICPGT